jgi:hypothetical protein
MFSILILCGSCFSMSCANIYYIYELWEEKICFSILGVTPHCTDDDIKKYYKRQAVLVHPDKNNQPGAEEAFKILVHAFELIGEPVSVLCFWYWLQVLIYFSSKVMRHCPTLLQELPQKIGPPHILLFHCWYHTAKVDGVLKQARGIICPAYRPLTPHPRQGIPYPR